MHQNPFSRVTLTICLALLLVACQQIAPVSKRAEETANGVDILFETVALNDSGANIDANTMREESQLILLASVDDVALIRDQVNPETYAQLQKVDFDEAVVIALMRGRKPSSNYQTVIKCIIQKGERFVVHAQFWEPNPAWESTGAVTSPYHIVKVARRSLPPFQEMNLMLETVLITPTPPASHPADTATSASISPTPGEQLQFETIEAREAPKPDYWRDRKPGLLIIASREDIGKASQYISDEAIATLGRMDFLHEFAVIAFHGWKPTVYYDFEVQKAVRYNDQISIFARSGYGGHQEAESSLYHLIKISKRGDWGQTYTFSLHLDDKVSDAIPVAAFIP